MSFVFFTFSAYCVVAKDALSNQISISLFLERVKADFKKGMEVEKQAQLSPKVSTRSSGTYTPTTTLRRFGAL